MHLHHATRTLTTIAALAILLLALPSAAQARTVRYVVVLKPNAHTTTVARRNDAVPDRTYAHAIRGFAAMLTPAQVRSLRADTSVRYVVADRPVHITARRKKPGGGGGGTTTPPAPQVVPTGISRIGADLDPTAAIDGVDTRVDADVAIIDTGTGPHADLNVVGGYNCATGRSYNDGNGHGTHVGGTIGALDNDRDVVGVAPGARLWSVRVLGNSGSGSWSSVICGIDWVTANAGTIDVANMSLGGSGSDDGDCGRSTGDAMHDAVCAAVAAGVTFVVAAGNDSQDSAGFTPAAYDEAITVSALADFDGQAGGGADATCRADEDDTFANFSNFGADVDIAAPGVCITSTWKGGGLDTISGTSMATPHVAGAAALLFAKDAASTPAQVRTQLLASAEAGPIAGDPDDFAESVLRVAP